MRKFAAGIGFLGACIVPHRALAQSAPAPAPVSEPPAAGYFVEFKAPVTCPTAEVFFDDIRSRTAKFKSTAREQASVTFVIAIRDEGARFVGDLTVQAGPNSSEQREVSAKSCEEVLETFALVVAVAIDPNASLGRHPKAVAPENPPAEVPPRAPAPTHDRPAPAALRPVASCAPQKPAARPSWHKAVSVGAEARGALSNEVALAGSLAFDVERRVPDGIGWLFRLSALRSLQSQVEDPLGRKAIFTWMAGRLDAGPTLFGADGRLSLGAAAGFDLGAIEAESESSVTRPWASALFQLRARYRLVPRLQVEVNAGAVAPMIRDRFALFGPESVIFRERALSGFLGFGLGLPLD